jgi:poly-gamma-glutamate synthesis protein (capsule biosynthesis protein)
MGGDFCITSSYLSNDLLSNNIIELFQKSDFNVINLECPIIEDNAINRIIKTGPHLKTNEKIFKYINLLNIHAVTLANNHILDYGSSGLKRTIESCNKNNIRYLGAGMNIDDASKPLIIEKENIKIAFLNFCETEWSIVTNTCGGANPLDLIDNLSQIKKAKTQADFVIVIIHGGHEYYQLPSPRMIKQYRFYAENGADAIIGHHTHCISGFEIHQNVPIVYSLGNMLFTIKNPNEEWYTGLIAQLHIIKNKPIKIEFIPIGQEINTFKLHLLNDFEKNTVLNQINLFSKTIINTTDLESEWKKFIQKNNKTINIFSPSSALPSRYIRAALNRLGLNKILMKKRYLKSILNHIRCDAHKDVIIELLKNKIYKDENRYSR